MIAKSPVGNYWDAYETLVILENYFSGEIAHLTGAGYRRHAQYVLPPHPAVRALYQLYMVTPWLFYGYVYGVIIPFL